MTIYDLKPKFQALLRPIVQTLANRGITPNQVTMFAMLLSILVGAIIALTHGAKWILLFVPLLYSHSTPHHLWGQIHRQVPF